MTIHLSTATIRGWIEDKSEHLGEESKLTVHVRKYRGSKAGVLDRYDSPTGESYANYDLAEQMLLIKCYDMAKNELLLQELPF